MTHDPAEVAVAASVAQPDRTSGGEASLLQQRFAALREHMNRAIIGQPQFVERLLLAVLADGHLLVEGAPALYLERGGRTALTFGGSEAVLARTAEAVAAAVRTGRLDSVSVERADGEAVRGSAAPLVRALREAGFVPTPRGLRLRAPLV